MRSFKPLLFAFAVLLVSACSTLATLSEPPKVKLKNVKLNKTDFKTAVLDIVLEVDNRNKVATTVDRLKYTLIVDQKEIANGVFDQKVELPAQSISQVSVPIAVRVQDLFSSVLGMLEKRGAPYLITGSIGVGIFNIPFDAKGEIELKDL